MRIRVPLPFADMEINVRTNRSKNRMIGYVVLSALFHLACIWAALFFAVRAFLPDTFRKQPPEIVTISSAVRIEHRPRPVPARARPQQRTVPVPRAVHVAAAPRRVPLIRQTPPPLQTPRHTALAYQRPPVSENQRLQAQNRTFERIIAQARAANDPVAGAVERPVAPDAPKRYTLNMEGSFERPRPEGILYPLKRWVDDGWVYYYVRYDAQYADGTTESGQVPWPIRFPEGADPFARGRQRMPLPGPMSDYVASADVAMAPLVRNCYDHRYAYCPIAHE